jgi:hypothetical protein
MIGKYPWTQHPLGQWQTNLDTKELLCCDLVINDTGKYLVAQVHHDGIGTTRWMNYENLRWEIVGFYKTKPLNGPDGADFQDWEQVEHKLLDLRRLIEEEAESSS